MGGTSIRLHQPLDSFKKIKYCSVYYLSNTFVGLGFVFLPVSSQQTVRIQLQRFFSDTENASRQATKWAESEILMTTKLSNVHYVRSDVN